MSEPVLLLGPSGIGKTTVVKFAMTKVKSIRFLVLDNIAHRYAREQGLITHRQDLNALIKALDGCRNRLLEFGREALATEAEQYKGEPLMVDVGTGFLDSKHSLGWIAGKHAIAITADPAVAFDRFRKARKLDISFEQYATTQFSKARNTVYQQASVVIKSDQLTEQQLCQQFLFSTIGFLSETTVNQAMQEYLQRAV